jgi:hypothetical protein
MEFIRPTHTLKSVVRFDSSHTFVHSTGVDADVAENPRRSVLMSPVASKGIG